MGKRELVALLNLSSWCLVMVERLFLAVPWGCLWFVIVVFPEHTHLLFSVCKEIYVDLFFSPSDAFFSPLVYSLSYIKTDTPKWLLEFTYYMYVLLMFCDKFCLSVFDNKSNAYYLNSRKKILPIVLYDCYST